MLDPFPAKPGSPILLSFTPEIGVLNANICRRKQVIQMKKQGSKTSRSSRSDKLNAIMKKLEDGVKELFTSENYQNYLRTMSKFHHYSFNNTLLIALQKPDATLVAGYGAWQQKFHRQVKKGEHGITVIAPVPVKEKDLKDRDPADPALSGDQDEKIHMFFRPATVFDISQTEGEPLPSIGVDELTGSAEGYQSFMEAMAALSPVPIRFDEIEGGAKGYYHTTYKEIVIQKDMSEAQTMKTCVHEVSHAILHDRDHMKAEGLTKDRYTKEVEAESVAFAVCAHFMLDTSDYSFPYIAGWSSSVDMKELKASMDTIRKTAGEIIESVEAELEKQVEAPELSAEKPSVLAALSKEKEQLKAEKEPLETVKAELIADRPHRMTAGKEAVL